MRPLFPLRDAGRPVGRRAVALPETHHSTGLGARLKRAGLIWLVGLASHSPLWATAPPRTSPPPTSAPAGGTLSGADPAAASATSALRAQLVGLLQSGQTEAAVRRAQEALRHAPDNPGVRAEYVNLHLALAQNWLTLGQIPAAEAALSAVLAVDKDEPLARELRRLAEAVEQRAARAAEELDDLLNFELYEAALESVPAIRAARPDLARVLPPLERAARRGAADDHYRARNFREAFALYEQLAAENPGVPTDVCARWGVALGLLFTEHGGQAAGGHELAARLRVRVARVASESRPELSPLRRVLDGLIAELAGDFAEAGQAYAAATDQEWSSPPRELRSAKVASLRRAAVALLEEQYQRSLPQRRDPFWSVALPGVWKHRQTARFDVYARNDLVAAHIGDCLEFHFDRLAAWLCSPAAEFGPDRFVVRIFADQAELLSAVSSDAAVRPARPATAASLPVSAEITGFQSDPWLLSATLPAGLAQAMLQRAYAGALPAAITAGIAAQAAPLARRSALRRQTPDVPPVAELLAMSAPEPGADERFTAAADALVTFLLSRPITTATLPPNGLAALEAVFAEGTPDEWWRRCGWSTITEAEQSWRTWIAARRNLPRLPLIILSTTGEPKPPRP